MARIPVVSRTLTTTLATVLCLDIKAETIVEKTVVLPRTYKDEKKLDKAVHHAIDNDEYKAIHTLNTVIQTKKYAMSEEEFATLAKPCE